MHTVTADIPPSLREATLSDSPAIYEAIHNHRDYLKVWLPFVTRIESVADEETFISSMLSIPYEERNIVFIIEQNNNLCGLIGFVSTDALNHRTEIGYWLLPEYQKKGIMTQCVIKLCKWAVEKRNMNRIQIRCAIDNQASNAIPKRLGFKLEGTERDGELLASGLYTDIHIYSILKKEIALWNNNQF